MDARLEVRLMVESYTIEGTLLLTRAENPETRADR
jgi:hypothetical protein